MNTDRLKALAVGDKVYVGHVGQCRSGWYEPTYTAGVVSKITDTGLIDVLIGLSTKPTRFQPDGNERGSRYHGSWIDTHLSFDERTTKLTKWVANWSSSNFPLDKK